MNNNLNVKIMVLKFMKFFVIHTKGREEFRALYNPQVQNFEVFLPTCQVQEKQKKKIHLTREVFSLRYSFIRLSDMVPEAGGRKFVNGFLELCGSLIIGVGNSTLWPTLTKEHFRNRVFM